MGGRTWQPHERELLEAHVDNDNWIEELHAALPDRTIYALREQMTKVRDELGIMISRVRWEAADLAIFEKHVGDDDWLEKLKAAFPNRTEMALKVQMSKLRVERGYVDGREIDAGWMVDARRGTAMLGEATLRLGTWT